MGFKFELNSDSFLGQSSSAITESTATLDAAVLYDYGFIAREHSKSAS